MLGAIAGDIIGSRYEHENVKNKNFDLFEETCRFTDDSVMTCAIAEVVLKYSGDMESFRKQIIVNMQKLGIKYINAGYGGSFIYWLLAENPVPYNSFGNGSAMRVSAVSYVANSIEEALELAKISAEVSHNHPHGIMGAQAVASAVYLALVGKTKDEIKNYIEDNFYNLSFKLDDIREDYKFDVTCQGSVPQAIKAFLEANNYEETIRNAISIGGDSDTIAAIAGGIAEAYYGMSSELIEVVKQYLPEDLLEIVERFYKRFDNKIKFVSKNK